MVFYWIRFRRKVVDYRFRATFGENELFELSIDRFKIADFREGSWVFDDREYFEAELEIVGERNLDSVKELYDLTRELREEFSLRPPKMSKSGVDVTNHGLVNVRGKDRAWYGSITEALKAADPGATVVVEPSRPLLLRLSHQLRRKLGRRRRRQMLGH